MAKKIKPVVAETQKVEPVIETPQVAQMAQTPDSLAEIVEIPEIEDALPSAILEEVAKIEEPVIEKKKEEVGITATIVEELSMEDKVKNFVESRGIGETRINEFLKSLFPAAKLNEPPTWQNQGATKQIKVILGKLHNDGDIEICGNAHMKLGMTYYPDTNTMRAMQHDLNSVPIFIQKVN